MTQARPVLVALRALGLGDLLAAVPALRALRRSFPDHHRVLAAPAWQAPLARLAGIDEVVDTAPLSPLSPELHGADIAVNLHGRGPESTAVLVASAPRRFLAFDVCGGPVWRANEHERHRWCRLLIEHGIAADPTDLRLPAPQGRITEIARGATLIHPGAAAEARRWPADRWAVIAAAEHAAGRRVLVTGSDDERELASTVASGGGLPADAVIAGRTGVVDLVALVGAASRVVCGDTGVAHVASALGTPSVVLFGPSPPALWGPPSNGPHVALWHGRVGDPLADVVDAGLAAITVDEVLDALARLPPRC